MLVLSLGSLGRIRAEATDTLGVASATGVRSWLFRFGIVLLLLLSLTVRALTLAEE